MYRYRDRYGPDILQKRTGSYAGAKKRGGEPCPEDITWWRVKDDTPDTGTEAYDQKMPEGSIYHAQAEEIRSSTIAERLIFQHKGLQGWREVARKVLCRIGWRPGCVFEDSIYPGPVGTSSINWQKVRWNLEEWNKSDRGHILTEVYIFGWQLNKVALGLTLVQCQEIILQQAIHLIGTKKEESAWAQAGLALAEGLKYLDTTLILANGKCGMTEADGAVVIYTDYAPLHCQAQKKRWGTYGVPPQPSPEYQNIEEILIRWTRVAITPTVIFHETNQGQLQRTSLKRKCKQWLQDRVNKGKIQIAELKPIPPQQTEVKQQLKNAKDQDEAEEKWSKQK